MWQGRFHDNDDDFDDDDGEDYDFKGMIVTMTMKMMTFLLITKIEKRTTKIKKHIQDKCLLTVYTCLPADSEEGTT